MFQHPELAIQIILDTPLYRLFTWVFNAPVTDLSPTEGVAPGGKKYEQCQ
jgi:hypothetical protein